MKTLKTIMMGLALLMVCAITKAATGTAHTDDSKDGVINTYLNAVIHGKLAGLNDALADEAQFNVMRGSNVNTLSKNQIMASFKSNENVDQGCVRTDTIVENSDEVSVLKVDMKFADYTRTDVITAERSGNGWKITKVDTSFS